MLLTGHADLEGAIRVVNGARLFRFLTKPCDPQELMSACEAALEQHRVQRAERDLLEQTLRGAVDALAEVLALANPAAFGRGGRVKTLAGRLARAVELANWWEVEVAAMLAHIGAVTLPQSTAEKLYADVSLTAEEAVMVARVPGLTRRLLSKIPRLEGVIEILDKYGDAADGRPGRPADAMARRAPPCCGSPSTTSGWKRRARARPSRSGRCKPAASTTPSSLDAFAKVVGVGAAPDVHEVSVERLREGMTLADDVRSVGGVLLVARGQRVSDQLIQRLVNLAAGFVREPLRILDGGHGA